MSILSEALRYRKLGYSVIPVKPANKRPYVAWEHWQQNLPSEAQIRSWWRQFPHANVAIITGAISGIVALDIDSAEGYREVIRRGTPETAGARTSRGYHVLFKHPDHDVRNFAGKLAGCDLRGDGGYIVAPPSKHANGHVYRWTADPEQFPPADMPTWLADLCKPDAAPPISDPPARPDVRPANGYAAAALQRELDALARCGEGRRNEQLNLAAWNLGQLVGGGLISRIDVETSLTWQALSIGLSERETRATIKSGIDAGMTKGRNYRPLERRQPERQPATTPPTPDADVVVNVRYLNQMPPIDAAGAWLVKSPIGTGKTEWAKDLVDSIDAKLGRRARVLVVSHRRSLAANIAKRFSFENYDGLDGAQCRQIDRLVIVSNSLHKLYSKEHGLERYDLIIIDEVEQALEHFSGDTFRRNEAITAHNILRTLISDAGMVVCLDAHASDVSLNWLRSIRVTKTIVNTHKRAEGRLSIYPTREQLIDAADHIIDASDKPVAFAVTTPKTAKVLERRYAKRYGEAAVMRIDSDNSQAQNVQDFIKHINEALPNLRVLIYSPSLGTGVDIQASVAAVIGVFHQQPLTAEDMLQMLGRCRNAERRLVHIQCAEGHRLTDADAIYTDYKAKDDAENRMCVIDAAGFDVIAGEQERLLRLHSAVTARRNRSLNNLSGHFTALAQERFDVQHVPHDDTDVEAIKQQLDAERDYLKEHLKALTLAADVVTPELLQRLTSNNAVTPEISAGARRYWIEDTFGTTITPELYDEYDDGRGRKRVLQFMDVFTPEGEVKARSLADAENRVPIHRRKHRTMRRFLCIVFLRPFMQDRAITAEPVALDALEAILQPYIEQFGADLRRFFGWRHDHSGDPLNVLRWVLKQMGLKLVRFRRGDGVKRYCLCAETLDAMQKHVANRRAMLAAKRQDAMEQLPKSVLNTSTHADIGTKQSAPLQQNRRAHGGFAYAFSGGGGT